MARHCILSKTKKYEITYLIWQGFKDFGKDYGKRLEDQKWGDWNCQSNRIVWFVRMGGGKKRKVKVRVADKSWLRYY